MNYLIQTDGKTVPLADAQQRFAQRMLANNITRFISHDKVIQMKVVNNTVICTSEPVVEVPDITP